MNKKLLKDILKKILSEKMICTIQLFLLARNKKMSETQVKKKIDKKYYEIHGRHLNWDHPQSFTEKICVSKIYMGTKEKTFLSDKISVREFVKERIGEEYLVPILGVYEKFENIDFASLPNSFVIKCNHDCNSVTIIEDKTELSNKQIKSLKWKYNNYFLLREFAYVNFEYQYKGIKPKIIIERYLGRNINDYKFFCFNGKVYCSYTMIDYAMNHSNGKMGFFNREYKLLPYYRKDFEPLSEQLDKPQNYEQMVEIAEKLSSGFSHVRVDLYNIDGKIYFGEMTFSNAGGLCQFEPEEFDKILGEQWDFDSEKRLQASYAT